jgi:hypothetical protein
MSFSRPLMSLLTTQFPTAEMESNGVVWIMTALLLQAPNPHCGA